MPNKKTTKKSNKKDVVKTDMDAMGKAGSLDIESYLKNVEYPADRQMLIDTARDHNAPGEVIDALEQIPDREYTKATEVTEEISVLE